MSKIVLINVSGHDEPGLTTSLTEVLSRYGVRILDIGQAVIHDTLSLGMLVQIPDQFEDSAALKDVLFHLHEARLQARFTPVSEDEYEAWVAGRGKSLYIITILGRQIEAEHLHRIATVVSANNLNIEDIQRLTRRISLRAGNDPQQACIQLSVRGETADQEAMQRDFMDIAHELGVDIAFQKEGLFRRNRRLVVFDMDSTLIQHEVIDELAAAAGVGDRVAAITEAAMRGEIDFQQSFRQRVALLAGLDAAVLPQLAARLELTEGVERLFKYLKILGYKTAIVSGGFTYFGRQLQQRLGIDHVHANELEIVDGRVTGRVVGEIIDGARKASLLREIAAREAIDLEQVVAVGDGANDLPMLRLAGLGIAFHAKPIVRATAQQSISTIGLDGILYLLGLRDFETSEPDEQATRQA
ncbi:MAG: phosphoserine phosphatase SerB [Gammaproteobacteria bacterium]|nr:MAG: phosphoserine phosphatase SerB [Gammaproteobacteria bacterium]